MSKNATIISTLAAVRSCAMHFDEGTNAEIISCGTIPWRIHESRLEVLLIHRTHNDDWAWPKGGLKAEETLPECAVRETHEEIGTKVALGIPLGVVTTPRKNGKTKESWFWAAELTVQKVRPDGKEVDRLEWVSVAEACTRLTAPENLQPLETLIQAHQSHSLRTFAMIVARHAKAMPRRKWSRAESERPLAATGRKQAAAVAQLVSVWRPERIVCSPWTRCVQTMQPISQKSALKIQRKNWLTEKANSEKPEKTRRKFSELWHRPQRILVCTHRPVLPTLLAVFDEKIALNDSAATVSAVARAVPLENPYLLPGGVIIAHRAIEKDGAAVSIEVYDSFDY